MVKKRKRTNGEGGDETREPVQAQQWDATEGYEEKTSDLAGFWNPEAGPVHFMPLYAKAFDSHLDNKKPTVVIVGHAIGNDPSHNKCIDSEENETHPAPGDLMGVWYKPGMAQIKSLANVRVFMHVSGEKDTGKPNPMVTFRILAKGKGETIYLQDDFRKQSKRVAIPFEVKGGAPKPGPVEDDDEDFGESANYS